MNQRTMISIWTTMHHFHHQCESRPSLRCQRSVLCLENELLDGSKISCLSCNLWRATDAQADCHLFNLLHHLLIIRLPNSIGVKRNCVSSTPMQSLLHQKWIYILILQSPEQVRGLQNSSVS